MKQTNKDTLYMILALIRKAKLEDFAYAFVGMAIFAGWGVLLGLGF